MTIEQKLKWFLSIIQRFSDSHTFSYSRSDGVYSVANSTLKLWIDFYLNDGYPSVKDRVYVLNSINSIYKTHLSRDYPLPKLQK